MITLSLLLLMWFHLPRLIKLIYLFVRTEKKKFVCSIKFTSLSLRERVSSEMITPLTLTESVVGDDHISQPLREYRRRWTHLSAWERVSSEMITFLSLRENVVGDDHISQPERESRRRWSHLSAWERVSSEMATSPPLEVSFLTD